MDKFFVKYDMNCYITGFKTDSWEKKNQTKSNQKMF